MDILAHMKSKTSFLDPIPTWLVKQFIPEFSPVLCQIVNLSFKSANFPDSLKRAIITPVLKKSSMDKEDLNNYRPISCISFLSKLIEKIAFKRINRHLLSNNLISPFQSAYREGCSTETVINHLMCDLVAARSQNKVSCVILFDLSSAFDMVDGS